MTCFLGRKPRQPWFYAKIISAEVQALLDSSPQREARPGQGLLPSRLAVLAGLVNHPWLNGKEVRLVKFDQERNRWVTQLVDSPDSSFLNVRAENLIWTALLKEALKEAKRAQQKQQEEHLKKQQIGDEAHGSEFESVQ